MFEQLLKEAREELKKDMEVYLSTGIKSGYIIRLEAFTKKNVDDIVNELKVWHGMEF